MKNKDFLKISKRLLPYFPGYVAKGPMLFSNPVDSLLRGIHFEGSTFDKESFYVWVFVMPTFVPTDVVSFNLGKRLRLKDGGDRWSVDASGWFDELSGVIKEIAIPFLEAMSSPVALARFISGLDSCSLYEHEVFAYSLAKIRQTERARNALMQLVPRLDPGIHWQLLMLERVKLVIDKLSDNAAVQSLLDSWERETISNFKLETIHSIEGSLQY
jgi:hypothetical protein